jgi:hypothetical protein
VRRDDRSCPICGAPVIPVRRFGEVPPYPVEYEQMREEDGPGMPRRSRPAFGTYALCAVSAIALAACGYFLR